MKKIDILPQKKRHPLSNQKEIEIIISNYSYYIKIIKENDCSKEQKSLNVIKADLESTFFKIFERNYPLLC